jgi:uncharacterized membrane protein YGL010W
MEQFASTTIWVTSLALPYLLFAVANPFRHTLITAIRALVAITAGWLLSVAYAIAAGALSLSNAPSEAARLAIYDTDGSKVSFALMFGWVLPSVIVLGSWVLHRFVSRRRRAHGEL